MPLMSDKVRALVYTRQSTHRDESISHELQEQSCRTYAAQQGYEVVSVLNERGKSGTSVAKREEFKTALQMMKDGQAEVMLVWRWSRFARNTLDGLTTLKMVEEEAGGRVECSTETIDRTALGKFSLTLLLGIAELESNQKSDSWKEALEHRLSEGIAPGGRDYWGYRKVGEQTKSGRLSHTGYEVVPEVAEYIRTAMQRIIDGHSLRQTALWLNSEGQRTQKGSRFQGPSLGSRLNNPFLRGLISWKGEEVPGAHEAIISEGMYRQYQQATANNKAQLRTTEPSHRLVGLVRCAKCGRLMSYQKGKPTKDRPNKVSRMECSTRRTQGKEACDMLSLKTSLVNDALDWWLPRHAKELEKAVPNQKNLVEQIETLKAKKDTLQEQITQTLTVGTQAGLTMVQMTDALTSIREESETVQTQINTLEAEAAVHTRPWWDIEDAIQGDDVREAKNMLGKVLRYIDASQETLVFYPVVGQPWTWYLKTGPTPSSGFHKNP